MNEKLRDAVVLTLAGVVIFAAGFFTHSLVNRNAGMTIVGKTLEFYVPGGTDTTPRPAAEKPIPRDSSADQTILQKVDSLERYIASLPAPKRDSAIVRRNAPFQIVVEDSVSTNYVTIDPLAPEGLRARTDSTQYKPLQLSFMVMDTTNNPVKQFGVSTISLIGIGGTAGALIGGPLGGGAGGIAGLIADLIFF